MSPGQPAESDRYHRQWLLPQVGRAGQERISAARVVVVGCGALGTVIADSLCRAGVGTLVVVDRDLVEWTNLQRQTLFSERDAADARPKAIAAVDRLGQINAAVALEPRPMDVDSGNVESLIDGADLVLDGTDNAATRYLLNDACVKHGLPWVYGACVGTEGRVMPVAPGKGPCLRCVFREMPGPGETATCDTAGVLGPAAGVIANLQAAAAIRLLVGDTPTAQLLAIDVWLGRFEGVDVSEARDPGCPCCGERRFEFLDRPPADVAELCGRDAVQVRGPAGTRLDLASLAARLKPLGEVASMPYMVRCRPCDRSELTLSVFSDGRLIVQGTQDIAAARSLYARYIGG